MAGNTPSSTAGLTARFVYSGPAINPFIHSFIYCSNVPQFKKTTKITIKTKVRKEQKNTADAIIHKSATVGSCYHSAVYHKTML